MFVIYILLVRVVSDLGLEYFFLLTIHFLSLFYL